jgi:tetratricopeptide (TPR) repeat protein
MRAVKMLAVTGISLLSLGFLWSSCGASHHALHPDAQAVAYHYSYPKTQPGNADGDTQGEIAALEAKIAKGQPSPVDLAELANLYLHRAQVSGDHEAYEEAERLATQSIELLPWPNGAVLVLAQVKNARHDFPGSIELAEAALKKGMTGARAILINSYVAMGKLDRAAELAEQNVMARPNSGAYFARALVLEAQGRDAEAALDFARAATVEEHGSTAESARIRALWGRFLLRRGAYDDAETLLAEALRIVPEHPLALGLMGELELRRGRYRQATRWFDQAFRVSQQVRYLIDEARARDLAGDARGAAAMRELVQRLVENELEHGGFGHRLDLCEVLIERGTPEDLSRAILLAQIEVTSRPSADTRWQLTRAFLKAGRKAEARTQIQLILASGAREPEYFEAAALAEVANPLRAAHYQKLADTLDPMNTGWRRLGLVRK